MWLWVACPVSGLWIMKSPLFTGPSPHFLHPARFALPSLSGSVLDVEYPWSSFGWYLAAPEHRPGLMRVDRLLGERGIQEDSAAGRQEFKRHREARRLEEAHEEELKPLRWGWCLGSERFRQEMLERMDGKLGENHSGELHRETAEQKANRILSEELSRRGWTESDLAGRRRSDPGKLAIAVRLRNETTLPVKWIAARVQIGTARGAESVLHRLGGGQHQRKPARADEPCAQLEFQSTAAPCYKPETEGLFRATALAAFLLAFIESMWLIYQESPRMRCYHRTLFKKAYDHENKLHQR
jgi:hypothetical protein